MSPDSSLTPEGIIDKSDPGSDVQLRFRYQATYAAILCLKLLEEDGDVELIFCEHHEDILIKKKDQTYIGTQVKTQDIGLGPFKTKDDPIFKSLKRFIALEKEFPGRFCRYVLATNNGFWHKKKNFQNPSYIIDVIKAHLSVGKILPREANQLINQLCAQTNSSPELIISVLNKVYLNGNLPGLNDIQLSLIKLLATLPGLDQKSHFELEQLAVDLVNRMLQASSLLNGFGTRIYFSLATDPLAEEIKTIIQNKKITKNLIQTIINKLLESEVLLKTSSSAPLSELPKGMKAMELKMAKGGISVANVNLIRDYKSSMEFLLSQWVHKYGPKRAQERYDHLRIIVLTECQEAYDLIHMKDFDGPKILIELRRRLRDRHTRESSSFFDCKYEQLFGIVGILTEECIVWWSDPFQIPLEHL